LGRQLRLKLERPLPQGREDFVVSPTNAVAAAALERFPSGDDVRLALVGPAASGKSHLAAVWAERVGAAALKPETCAGFDLSTLEGRPVLLEDADRAPDEVLFHLYNLAGVEGGALLVTSRARPVRWATALPDLRSRLGALRVVEIAEPDDAVLRTLLERQFERLAVQPSGPVLDFLVRRMERSAGAARTLAEQVVDKASEDRKPVNLPLVRTVVVQAEDEANLFD
jgi:chromosomal replication initiation ATPase DnaA